MQIKLVFPVVFKIHPKSLQITRMSRVNLYQFITNPYAIMQSRKTCYKLLFVPVWHPKWSISKYFDILILNYDPDGKFQFAHNFRL